MSPRWKARSRKLFSTKRSRGIKHEPSSSPPVSDCSCQPSIEPNAGPECAWLRCLARVRGYRRLYRLDLQRRRRPRTVVEWLDCEASHPTARFAWRFHSAQRHKGNGRRPSGDLHRDAGGKHCHRDGDLDLAWPRPILARHNQLARLPSRSTDKTFRCCGWTRNACLDACSSRHVRVRRRPVHKWRRRSTLAI